MKQLYLDCNMGAAGDMLTAALYELLDDEGRQKFTETMNGLAPEGVEVSVRPETKCGILGTHFDVVVNGEEEHSHDHHEHGHAHCHDHEHHDHEHEHAHCHDHDHPHTHEHEHTHTHAHMHGGELHTQEHAHEHIHEHCSAEHTHEYLHDHDHPHTHEHAHCHDHPHTHEHEHTHTHAHHSMADVEAIIDGFSGISDAVKDNIKEVYKVVAAAESEVHGTSVSEIHFHEVGMMDAIIDVTAVCLLMDMLGPDKVTASPVRVGYGHMRCAHGILPVPAPATANILRGIPTYAGRVEAELCTPTGAALLRHFATEFSDQPLMTVDRIGYGMGTKNFEVCNCVRAMIGESH